MGKVIIVRGADFSANAVGVIPIEWEDMTLAQGLVVINSSTDYGNIKTTTDPAYTKRMYTPTLIKINNGETIYIKGLKGLDGTKTALRMDAAYYSANVASSANVVGSISNKDSTMFFPLNSDGSSDEVSYTNNTGGDYYYAFTIRNINNTTLPPADYSPLQYCII